MGSLRVLVGMLATGLALLALSPSRSLEAHAQDYFQTPWDAIPNFALNPTIQSTSTGGWSSPATWTPSRAPNGSDVVLIGSGTTVTVDVISATAKVVGVGSGGKLQFRTDASTSLRVGTLEVQPGGNLEAGTAASPVPASVSVSIVIAGQALDHATDPEEWGTGLIDVNGRVSLQGSPKPVTFARLAAEPSAGATTLNLAEAVSGWNSGDRLVLPDSRALKEGEERDGYQPRWEELTLSGVSGDGRTLTLSAPLRFDHPGAHNPDGHVDFYPHVADLSRNITIRSESPAAVRGHVAFTDRADVDMRYTALRDLGRTTFDPVGPGNHIGRYSLHVHHLMGPVTAPADGYQYTLLGNAIDGGSDFNSHKWGITVHDSHYGLVKDNVIYDVGGAGFMTETGNESFNVIDHNFVMRVKGTGGRPDDSNMGANGNGFWIRGPNNYLRNNVVTDVVPDLDTQSWIIYQEYLGSIRIPKARGADTSDDAQVNVLDGNAMALLEFSGNEAYGAIELGLQPWWVGTFGGADRDAPESIVKDFRVWNAWRSGIYGYPVDHITYDHLVVRGDPASPRGEGWHNGDYSARRLVLKNADIQGMSTGILGPLYEQSATVVQDSYLRNLNDVVIRPMTTVSYTNDWMPPKTMHLRNTRFAALPGHDLAAISLAWWQDYELAYVAATLIQRDEVRVTSYQGVVGDDFQVFYAEQAPSVVLPKTVVRDDGTIRLLGSPEAGLSNAENWSRHQVATAGAVAPCADGRDGISGLVCRVTTVPLPDPGPYRALAPYRVLDTRATGGRLGPNSTLDLQVAGSSPQGGAGGVPATGAGAVVLNVAVTNASQAGYVTVYPTGGGSRPTASNLNFGPGQTIANLSVVTLGSSGRVSFYNSEGTVDIIADVQGYFSSGGTGPSGLFNALPSPTRILDTRQSGATLGPNTVLPLKITGDPPMPSVPGASAVVLNVTAVNGSRPSYLTVYPHGAGSRPEASNLNFPAGRNLPNRVIVKMSPEGMVDIYNSEGLVEVVVDLAGYFTDASPGAAGALYHPANPGRVLDTRPPTQVGAYGTPFGPDQARAVAIAGRGPQLVPASGATGVVMNVTVTNPTAGSFLTVYPDDAPRPLASDLNFGPLDTLPNLDIVKLGAGGGVQIYNNQGSTDVLADVAGWFG